MIANFIFHFIFAIFAIWAGIAWFILHNRYQSLRQNLIPILCSENIDFYKNRSLFIRAIKTLEQELSDLYKVKVSIDIKNFSNQNNAHFMFHTLSSLLSAKTLNSESCYEFNNETLNAIDFSKKMASLQKLKNLKFIYKENIINNKNIWLVEMLNAK